jgi:hypothetical protein
MVNTALRYEAIQKCNAKITTGRIRLGESSCRGGMHRAREHRRRQPYRTIEPVLSLGEGHCLEYVHPSRQLTLQLAIYFKVEDPKRGGTAVA